MEKEKSKKPSSKKKYSDESSLLSSNDEDEKSSDFERRDDSKSKKKEEEDEIQKFSKQNDGSKKKVFNIKPEEKTLELKDIESIRLTRHMIEKMVFENFKS